jgi:iron complex transport system ATP-binding protein
MTSTAVATSTNTPVGTGLRLDGLHFDYGDVPVLRGVSLEAGSGELVGVLGPNGCGKTTLFKLIIGSLKPASGRIDVNGTDLSGLGPGSRARRVAAVPQDPVAPVGFTVADLVMMGRNPHLGLLEFEGEQDRAIVIKAMQSTDIIDLAHRPVSNLSGGERQRVFVAMALVQRAPVLLLDEPTSNLDLAAQATVMALVQRLCRERGDSVLVAMHDLTLAAQWCDRLVLMDEGKVRTQGTPDEVLTEANVAAVYGADVVIARHPQTGAPVVLPRGVEKRPSGPCVFGTRSDER